MQQSAAFRSLLNVKPRLTDDMTLGCDPLVTQRNNSVITSQCKGVFRQQLSRLSESEQRAWIPKGLWYRQSWQSRGLEWPFFVTYLTSRNAASDITFLAVTVFSSLSQDTFKRRNRPNVKPSSSWSKYGDQYKEKLTVFRETRVTRDRPRIVICWLMPTRIIWKTLNSHNREYCIRGM
jgi:hypothetical protein